MLRWVHSPTLGLDPYLSERVQQAEVVSGLAADGGRQVQVVLLDVEVVASVAVVGDESDGGVMGQADFTGTQLEAPGGHRWRYEDRDSWPTCCGFKHAM